MPDTNTNRQLRSFGLVVGGVFLVVGLWPWLRRGDDPRLWASVLGGALILPGLLFPALLAGPYRLWMKLAHILGWINTKIILSLMFYLVFTPTAFILRLMGKDPMNRSLRSEAESYRVRREARSASHLKHQF